MDTCLTADAYTEEPPEPVYMPELLLDVMDSGSDGVSELLISDDEEEDDFLIAPSSRAAKPTAVEGTVPSPTSLDLDMQEVCKCAAAKLNIPWPAVQTETTKSRYDGKRLPKMKKMGKQLLPVFP